MSSFKERFRKLVLVSMFHTIWMGLDLKPDPCCKCVAKITSPSNLSSNWHTPSRESQCNVCLKTNRNGTLLIQEVTEVSAKLCRSAWDAVRQQSSISFNVRCFLLALKLGIILWTLHLCSHCIGYFEWFCWTTQWDASLPQSKWSDQPKIQVQPLVAHAAR